GRPRCRQREIARGNRMGAFLGDRDNPLHADPAVLHGARTRARDRPGQGAAHVLRTNAASGVLNQREFGNATRARTMSSITVSLIVFASVLGGGLLGLLLHAALPQHHLSGDSKDAVKVGVGLVGTMAALVLGLLVASAKASYDAQGAQLIQ